MNVDSLLCADCYVAVTQYCSGAVPAIKCNGCI